MVEMSLPGPERLGSNRSCPHTQGGDAGPDYVSVSSPLKWRSQDDLPRGSPGGFNKLIQCTDIVLGTRKGPNACAMFVSERVNSPHQLA